MSAAIPADLIVTHRVLRVATTGLVELIELDALGWRELSDAIGAPGIERVLTPIQDCVLVVDEEGWFAEQPTRNIGVTPLYPGIIVGDALVVSEVWGPEGADFVSLTDEHLAAACELMRIEPAADDEGDDQ